MNGKMEDGGGSLFIGEYIMFEYSMCLHVSKDSTMCVYTCGEVYIYNNRYTSKTLKTFLIY